MIDTVKLELIAPTSAHCGFSVRGSLQAGFADNHNLRREYGVDIYGLKSGTCVAVIHKALEWDNFDVGWGRHNVYISTLTSRSLDELASELQDPDLMTCPGYSEVVMYTLHKLFPDDPDYFETIE